MGFYKYMMYESFIVFRLSATAFESTDKFMKWCVRWGEFPLSLTVEGIVTVQFSACRVLARCNYRQKKYYKDTNPHHAPSVYDNSGINLPAHGHGNKDVSQECMLSFAIFTFDDLRRRTIDRTKTH